MKSLLKTNYLKVVSSVNHKEYFIYPGAKFWNGDHYTKIFEIVSISDTGTIKWRFEGSESIYENPHGNVSWSISKIA